MAIPENAENQKVIDIVSLGKKNEIEIIGGKKYAKYSLTKDDLNIKSIGYKCKLNLRSYKKTIKNTETFKISTKDVLSAKEKEELEVDDSFFQQYVIKEPLNDINKILYLRNVIYKRLTYKKNIYAKNFKEVLENGYGTCGDYASLMLIFFNLNNISCNSASGYKIPRFYNATSGIISIYFNHTWIEIYDNEGSALPIESSSDDKEFAERFSERQFLGIDWSHIKLYNGKANPNLIKITTSKEIHPFDIFKKASIFVKILREIL